MHCAIRRWKIAFQAVCKLTQVVSRLFALLQGSLVYSFHPSSVVVGPMHDVLVCCLQIADEVKDYKKRNPSWHGPKSIKKRTG